MIAIDTIRISEHHRALKPWALPAIADSMKEHGYNPAYPIVVDENGTLVDGRHRIVAAMQLGITEVPYTLKPAGVSSIRFGLQCNADGQLGSEDDVFDFAELCWNLTKIEKWSVDDVSKELLWSPAKVSFYSNIRRLMHPKAWALARFTNITKSVNEQDEDVVNVSFTKVNWTERHFRALLERLPCPPDDNAMMRAQVKAVRAIIARAGEKDKRFNQTQKTVTARWISELAGEYAWHVKLAKHMRDNLVQRVPIRDRIGLLKSVYRGDYGDKDDAKMFVKFNAAVMKLNEQALGVILYEDDSLRRIPMLEDNSIALVVTDPPYNVTEHEWDKIGSSDEYIDFMRQWLAALRPKLTEDYHLFFFCDPDYASRIETEIIIADEWPLLSRVIWWNRSLPSGRQPDMRFVRTWQMCFHIGTHGLNFAPEWSDARFDVQSYAAPNGNTKDGGFHPTGKPQKFIEYLVQLGSKPTDVVLDPFAGGGTTGAACGEIQQRRCILIEKSADYCEVIERRLQIKREQ